MRKPRFIERIQRISHTFGMPLRSSGPSSESGEKPLLPWSSMSVAFNHSHETEHFLSQDGTKVLIECPAGCKMTSPLLSDTGPQSTESTPH